MIHIANKPPAHWFLIPFKAARFCTMTFSEISAECAIEFSARMLNPQARTTSLPYSGLKKTVATQGKPVHRVLAGCHGRNFIENALIWKVQNLFTAIP
jgi:hypothetical protein